MGNWRERQDEPFDIACSGECSVRMTARQAAEQLISLDEALREAGREPRFYGFGDHVTDPLAVVRRFLHFRGYDETGRIDRMTCPIHRKKEKV